MDTKPDVNIVKIEPDVRVRSVLANEILERKLRELNEWYDDLKKNVCIMEEEDMDDINAETVCKIAKTLGNIGHSTYGVSMMARLIKSGHWEDLKRSYERRPPVMK
jgi:hypothetical protein